MECTCCSESAEYSIQVAEGSEMNGDIRYYLPNQGFRDVSCEMHEALQDVLAELPFCRTCMRAVEDNFRNTIERLQGKLTS